MSKKSAIMYIQNIMTMLNGKDSRVFSESELRRLSDNLFLALEELKEGKSPWVSVNDKMPPMDEEVIVLNEIGRISFGHIVDKTIAKDYDGWNIPDVAFWMPYKPSDEMNEFYEKEDKAMTETKMTELVNGQAIAAISWEYEELDNGCTLADPKLDAKECAIDGEDLTKPEAYDNARRLLGSWLYEELRDFIEKAMSSHVRIKISFEDMELDGKQEKEARND